ncbi:PREDICTED: uncharacterized protein LOC109581262 isoform X4 [Amphimedon queenslandica]|uniref:Death domain-containing protein n=1 Tax=Amphimedon queenslandica TaxID=400682 RepID=A0AAN0J1C0_AMPQE|nr:PREDICTED: uncharacterized protein LOC109581262 isoform X4 [Amphimedon queenslandica]|eukprot:XP_019850785.1 PREDICTED: uncharacterized protein LOC109581262 isoform X4 [Amphimedon queenslandica]
MCLHPAQSPTASSNNYNFYNKQGDDNNRYCFNMASFGAISILYGRTLNIGDLGEVIALLERHNYSKASYNRLGLRLKISQNTLEKIKKDYGEVDRCFTECLASWLRKADSVKNPTIGTLIAALRGIRENAVADGIDRERQNRLSVTPLILHSSVDLQIDEPIEKPAKKMKVDTSSSFMQSKTASIKKAIPTTSTTVVHDKDIAIATRSHVTPGFETKVNMAECNESKEATLFKRYSSDFKRAMINPVEVAGVLYSNSIIDETTRNRITQRHHGSDLVDAVEAYVISLPKKSKRLVQKFEGVLNILKQYIPLNSIVESLEIDYYGRKAVVQTSDPQYHHKDKSGNLLSSELMKHSMPPSDKKGKHRTESILEGGLPDSLQQNVEASEVHSQPQDIKTSTPSAKSSMKDTIDKCDVDYSSDPHIKQLENALQVYASDLSDSGLDTQATLDRIKARIESHIKKKLEDGLSKDTLTKQLHDLTMNALIPMDINDWCYDRLDELYKEHDEKMSNSKDSFNLSSDDLCEEVPPIFSADVVYHASLCNLVISEASNFLSMKVHLSQFGHSFNEASLSIDKNILIALQENIIYIAFRGIVDFPLRYFCELLHMNKRVVFTGFLHGILPAVSFLVQLWNLPYFSAKILVQNVTCILFGLQGLESHIFAHLENGVHDSPDILKSFHLFLLHNELKTSFYGERFYHLEKYKEIVYLIQQTHNGLKYIKAPSLETLRYIPFGIAPKPELFDMQVYHQHVLRGYLDKEQYCIPSRKSLAGSVKSLMPSILKIELYQHKHPGGNELSIVINGDNLWFCSDIEVNFSNFHVKIKTSVESLAQKQICYNQLLDRDRFLPVDRNKNCLIKVHSRFSNPLKSDVPIIYNEPDLISFRPSQLAKQTPSQIIQLSFLSALLEQSPSVRSGRPTKRFKQIIKFLQEASTIVPMESAIFSVASCADSPSSSAKIIQAVVNAAHLSSIPVSKMMISGSREVFNKPRWARYLYEQPSMHIPRPVYNQPIMYNHFYGLESPSYYTIPGSPLYSFEQEKIHENLRSSQTSAIIPYAVHDSSFSVSLQPHECQFSYFERFQKILYEIQRRSHLSTHFKLICGRNIGELYPISKAVSSLSNSDALTPLSQVLQNARTRLTNLSSSHQAASLGGIAELNSSMLGEVNKIVHEYLTPCVTMLGGFMEQQIKVPLVNNPLDTAKALRMAENSGAIGVWALFSLNSSDIKYILSSRKNETLVIQIAKFIEGTFSENIARKRHDVEPTSYDAKLQFLLELGLNRAITCSNDYISYSLERELVSICKEQGISTSTSVSSVIRNWSTRFKDTGLVLVPHAYRPLLARWLIWSLNIHQLREGLASYTTVGVIGLVNSGKSTLVNKVFKVETIQGTSQAARTTVPFIYNLDSSVEGLSVIDFPGVDDRDESIGGLAKLLVGLAQIVIFVCGYERFHTSSAMDWMKIFLKDFADTPILVCLTHADRLYENNCEKDMIPECPRSKIPGLRIQFEDELQKIIGDTERTEKCFIKFCSLTQTRHSPLNDDRGRQSMRKVGIFTPEDIGEWVKNALIRDIQQEELADKFSKSLNKF